MSRAERGARAGGPLFPRVERTRRCRAAGRTGFIENQFSPAACLSAAPAGLHQGLLSQACDSIFPGGAANIARSLIRLMPLERPAYGGGDDFLSGHSCRKSRRGRGRLESRGCPGARLTRFYTIGRMERVYEIIFARSLGTLCERRSGAPGLEG